MPVLKFSRDKRGYEHFYLVQPSAGRRGKVRSRILYWFRTPPNVKVGTRLFDASVRLAIENRYPDLEFDWDALLETPIPAPDDSERWRERRRMERAAKAAAAEPEPDDETALPAVTAAAVPDAQPPADPAVEAKPDTPIASEKGPRVSPPQPPSRARRRRRRGGQRGRRAAGGPATTDAGALADSSAIPDPSDGDEAADGSEDS